MITDYTSRIDTNLADLVMHEGHDQVECPTTTMGRLVNVLVNTVGRQQLVQSPWSETNFTTRVKLLDPENPLLGEGMGVVSPIQAKLLSICRNFQISLPCFGARIADISLV